MRWNSSLIAWKNPSFPSLDSFCDSLEDESCKENVNKVWLLEICSIVSVTISKTFSRYLVPIILGSYAKGRLFIVSRELPLPAWYQSSFVAYARFDHPQGRLAWSKEYPSFPNPFCIFTSQIMNVKLKFFNDLTSKVLLPIPARMNCAIRSMPVIKHDASI